MFGEFIFQAFGGKEFSEWIEIITTLDWQIADDLQTFYPPNFPAIWYV